MSVVKIALGVFLGNLAFALLTWIVVGVLMTSQTATNNARMAHDRLEALRGH